MDETRKKYHMNLSEYFLRKPFFFIGSTNQQLNIRKLNELPWQLFAAEQPEKLRLCLSIAEIFECLATEKYRWDLVKYWGWLKSYYNPENAYLEVLPLWKKTVFSKEKLVTLLAKLAMFLTMIERDNVAVSVLEEAMRIVNRDDEVYVIVLNNLARSLTKTGEFVRAELIFQEILEIKKEKLGIEQPSTSVTRINLAEMFRHRATKQKIETLFEQIIQDRSEKKSLKLFEEYINRKPDRESAELELRSLLIQCEQKLGTEHILTLTIVNNLGLVLSNKADYSGAESFYLRAIEGRERILGNDHPDTLVSVFNLARMLINLGDYDKARPLLERVIKGFNAVYGPNYIYTQSCIKLLSEIT